MTVRVAALGGSLLRPEVEDRQAWLRSLSESVRDITRRGIRLVLVVGGGAPAREGIQLAEPLIGEDVAALDRIGIAATRLNARIVSEAISCAGIEVPDTIPESIENALLLAAENAVVIMGGTVPGHTTDNVAIMMACALEADRCLIATNVSHVHSADPRNNPDAIRFEEMSHDELREIVGPPIHRSAGGSGVIDPIGADRARKAGLPLAVLDGRHMERLHACLCGEAFEGTNIEG
ncbi:MAG TPA: UMP kinase [Candidatus Thalassarchaeaceae archaeon]|nr:MAG TPA: UMP kinase [Candidatus Poseidoniales archaeon]HII49556.1 UMP kinase [Candidatus Thalassarchaeaceae archaeon]|tara:strand:- start:953 stop:1657 length:705 start_codon:yes stop_codon:yes gene_type:complete